MREILFRGKRIDNGEWIEGDLVGGNMICPTLEDVEDAMGTYYGQIPYVGFIEVIPETVGMYTGLTDKNGKKIFEGDIVKDGWGKICIIRFGKGYFDSGIYEFYGWYTEYLDETERNIRESLYVDSEYPYYKVICNIHDNPEFLEAGE